MPEDLLRWDGGPTAWAIYRGVYDGSFWFDPTLFDTAFGFPFFTDASIPPTGRTYTYLVRRVGSCGEGP